MEADVIKLEKLLANEKDIELLLALSNNNLKDKIKSLEDLIRKKELIKYEINYIPEKHEPNFNYILEFSGEGKPVKPYVTFFYTPQSTFADFGVKKNDEIKNKFDNLDKKLYILGKDNNSAYVSLIRVNSATFKDNLINYNGNEINENYILVVPLEKESNYVTKILLYSPSYQKVKPLLKGKRINSY